MISRIRPASSVDWQATKSPYSTPRRVFRTASSVACTQRSSSLPPVNLSDSQFIDCGTVSGFSSPWTTPFGIGQATPLHTIARPAIRSGASKAVCRAISPVQLTTYYLGYREVRGVYDEARSRLGPSFDLRAFMDGMMRLGPVAARHYRDGSL